MNPNYETQFQKDWSLSNQIGLKRILLKAFEETEKLCSPALSPIFTTPNQHFQIGNTRHIATAHYLEMGCKTVLSGITPSWRPVLHENGYKILELRGEFTQLTVCHIPEPDAAPKDAVFRVEARTANQVLMEFEDEAIAQVSPLLNLTLVYGGKKDKFAFIRSYSDPERPGSFEDLSQDIMGLPIIVVPIDEEHIEPPSPDIQDDLRLDDEDEEGQSS